MRLLLDANLSPRVAGLLRASGFDAVHVRDRAMQRAPDPAILERAAQEERVLVSEDTDFGALLARSGARLPSFVLLRSGDPLTPDEQARLLTERLARVEDELARGAVVVIEPTRLRVRSLPLRPDS